jgi:dUTP pyrophosphatase
MSDFVKLKFKKLTETAKLPTQGKPGDAAYDLYSTQDVYLSPGETLAISTGLQLADMPSNIGENKEFNLYLQIKGRSGLATKGCYPIGGVVDSNYRGEIKVILHNGNVKLKPEDLFVGFMSDHSPEGYCAIENQKRVIAIKTGDRIAQFTIEMTPRDIRIEETWEVTDTNRGSSGFGSTGV